MDIQDKSHVAANYIIGGTAAASPWWMSFIQITDPFIHWLTGAIGLVIVVVQFYRTVKKKKDG